MTSPQTKRNGSVVWIVAIAVVVVLGVIAVLASRGGDDADAATGQASSVEIESNDEASPVTNEDGAAASGALPVYDATTEDPAVGMTIPSVTGQDFDGNPITIEPDGKAKILLFVAHWCPHCQREVPMLKAHLDDVPMPDDVELITVSTSVKPGADNYPPQEWLAEEGWTAPVLADDEDSTVAATFGLSSFPYFVVVDADGKVVARATGELSAEQFDVAVEAAQTGELPS